MQRGFWHNLTRPFTALAPMSGITDAPYRAIIAKYGKPDVMFTSFVSADGLDSPGYPNLEHLLWKTPAEHPIVAQIYGGEPASYRGAVRRLKALGFDGVDINMGCPAKQVEKRAGGSALIKDHARAREIVAAALDGAGDLPVSVKTRIGYRVNELEDWLPVLLESRPVAITIHARTRNEGYKTHARWQAVQQAVTMAAELYPDEAERPLIIGNGDIATLADIPLRAAETGCAGIMVGRPLAGDPWFFNPRVAKADLPLGEVLGVMIEHIELYDRLYGRFKPFEPLKKHLKAYVGGFRGAAQLRARLMSAGSVAEVKQIVADVDRWQSTPDN
ncbi:tRNA-dihydrouridine synthase [bacterium]|nr:tRNA-dihydrouridine synthase [bacterium]